MTDMPGQTAPKDRRSRASMTNNELAQIEREQVQEHIAEIMFDTHDGGDPDCLLCKRGVELGLWARYGYPDGPWCTCEIAADLGFSGYGDGVNPNTIVATRPDCPQHGVHGWEH